MDEKEEKQACYFMPRREKREVKFSFINDAVVRIKWGDHIVFLFGISQGLSGS